MKYLQRVLADYPNAAKHRCPGCGCDSTIVVSRKAFVTALKRCNACKLQFRTPTDPTNSDRQYQSEYSSGGLTTTLPGPEKLEHLVKTCFSHSDKDFSQKISLLARAGVKPGAKILDFGASWGYATWQLRRAGYDASGFEISAPRAEFGKQNLAVEIATREEQVGAPYDAIFSSHVLEHISNPARALNKLRRWLRDDGVFVGFTPNGSAKQLPAARKVFDHHWGRLHPVHIDELFLLNALPDIPLFLTSRAYGSWGEVPELDDWKRTTSFVGELTQPELLTIFVRGPHDRADETASS